jgi:DNA mismatch repair ATPase MutS
LATFAFENPDYSFPTFQDEGPYFKARNLAHPLLPRDRRIGNDLVLSGNNRLLLISGSNMSGKSTLLRSVGINTVLAFAGAPVCAEHFCLSQLAIGASIRTHDSLSEGVSRFYAEIKRLTAIRNLAAGRPVLYLLDEILHGTNSHDRRIGAEGVLKDLVAKPGIGLVTTHDLALTEITTRLTPPGTNMHFEDHLDGDRIAFDYTLRLGPVTQGNALALMRSLGLEV